MTNEENKISDMIDAGLVIRESIEELAAKCFVMPKNKKGEAITTPVGANPKGWKAHLKSFTKGYLARADERENKCAVPYQLCPKCNGQGQVTKPPYIAGDVQQWSNSSCIFTCDVCNGSKIIAMFQPTPPKQ